MILRNYILHDIVGYHHTDIWYEVLILYDNVKLTIIKPENIVSENEKAKMIIFTSTKGVGTT